MNYKLFVSCLVFILLPMFGLSAAEVYLDPVNISIAPEDILVVKVKINPEEPECVNSGQIVIDFSDNLSFKDFSVAESIFSLWVERPDDEAASLINKDRRIVFSGGIPGGYCGQIPGDIGESNILGELIFETASVQGEEFETAYINISNDSSLYLNDGLGTLAKIKTSDSNIRIDGRLEKGNNEWLLKLEEDNVLPEPFVVTIDEYRGRKFAAFSTTDKQTGIDYYEILEARPKDFQETKISWIEKLLGGKVSGPIWKVASSPYYLKDQDLKSIIKVRAVDKAGNKRVVEYQNEELSRLMSEGGSGLIVSGYLLSALLGVLIAILLALIIRNRRLKRTK